MSWREPRHDCLELEEMTWVSLKNCTPWSSCLCLWGSGLWKETVHPKSYHQEFQLLMGIGSERNRQRHVWVGAHVCLSAHVLLWKESDWKCQLSWLKNIHYGGMVSYTFLIYLLNLELNLLSWVPLSVHKIQQPRLSEPLMSEAISTRDAPLRNSSSQDRAGEASAFWTLAENWVF